MLLHEFYGYLEEAMILFDKLEYLEENGETNIRMHELYKEFKRILLLEAVTDTIKNLQDFLEMFGSEIELYYDKKISMMILQADSES
jgi:uncharacterized protein YktA (UPF0223 family)